MLLLLLLLLLVLVLLLLSLASSSGQVGTSSGWLSPPASLAAVRLGWANWLITASCWVWGEHATHLANVLNNLTFKLFGSCVNFELMDWLTDWLTDWLVDWLTDWLTSCLVVSVGALLWSLLGRTTAGSALRCRCRCLRRAQLFQFVLLRAPLWHIGSNMRCFLPRPEPKRETCDSILAASNGAGAASNSSSSRQHQRAATTTAASSEPRQPESRV